MIAAEEPLHRDALPWRGMSRAELDSAYNNAGAVEDSGDYLADWAQRSAALRLTNGTVLDLPYGPRERNRMDIFRGGASNAPLLVFIHGGYWQRNTHRVFSAMAEGALALGIDVACPGYTLAPDATLAEMMTEIATALQVLRRQGPELGVGTGRLVVSGWSAGGHLAASAMALPEVDSGLAISGIFDLEPIRLGSLNDKLGLTVADVAALSPIRHIPRHAGELVVTHGTAELPELQRQSQDYARAWLGAGLPGALLPIPGENHFSILEQLARPGGVLALQVARLAGQV